MKPRKSLLKRSAIKRSTKPIKKVNVERQAKRKVAYRKMLSGKEYKAARAEAMERAGNQCERLTEMVYSWAGGGLKPGSETLLMRCTETLDLHAHHIRYPKTRRVDASDLQILCRFHHEQAESGKMHKTRMF